MSVTRGKPQALIAILFILVILAIDQYSKFLVQLKLSLGESIPIIKNILHITFVGNAGAAFGLFKNSTWVFIVTSVVAIIFISILLSSLIKKGEFLSQPLFSSCLILIVAGAFGNLIDRLRFGYVVDFIDLRIWPVFNIADTSITIGAILLIFTFMPSRGRRNL
ncbi:signal peptidase II [Candidatus Omnitrophota bacterium]